MYWSCEVVAEAHILCVWIVLLNSYMPLGIFEFRPYLDLDIFGIHLFLSGLGCFGVGVFHVIKLYGLKT